MSTRTATPPGDAESVRLHESITRKRNWKRWGPYLSERQWGTVREDYSDNGDCWNYFTHDQARSRAYRWGEDGLMGVTDRECRMCFALALWNGQDPILKERLFGLTNPEGNHGEDVKEEYFYLDSTPTHSYMKTLYKYPQAAFPYQQLIDVNRERGVHDAEFELSDTGVFDDGRYFDVMTEYAKAGPNDLLIRVTVSNRGPDAAEVHVLPTLWFRNTWSWGTRHEGCGRKPMLKQTGPHTLLADHDTLGRFVMQVGPGADGESPELMLTENDTNAQRLWGAPNAAMHVKDAFHERVIRGRVDAVNPAGTGTKAAAWYKLRVPAGESVRVQLRLTAEDEQPKGDPFGKAFNDTFKKRATEADAFYAARLSKELSDEQRNVARQAYAGLLFSKQFYHYIVEDWLKGDPAMPPPPPQHQHGRNAEWEHLYNRDVVLMPDKWEYPWYAAWDLAFHAVALAKVDGDFAKKQLMLLLREWYMHPNGQLPAYEFHFDDVNPPVHAWACWRVYKMTGPRGKRDRKFLESCFQKLLLNFTWWVNRKDPQGNHLFSGGFLGLDNIGVFDRSQPLPGGATLTQADGTAWMAFYCGTMLAIALELAEDNPVYEDMASKFFEHFVAICDAMNTLGGNGLWDEEDGFYYDQLHVNEHSVPVKARSLVGLIPLCTATVFSSRRIDTLPGFRKRMDWFLEYRGDLARHVALMERVEHQHGHEHLLLAIPSQKRLRRVLTYMLDENEFLSPYGIRSLSRAYRDKPYQLQHHGQTYGVAYDPAESTTDLFGGNSNWRGPVWFPINYLLVEALERYHHFYGDSFQIECPTGSGNMMTLLEVAHELDRRLSSIFMPDDTGRRPAHGHNALFTHDANWRDLVLFYEYFDGDTGRGCGANHQTGWTALITHCVDKMHRE
ncbi:MAG: glucosidase [Phycisphaera sp.]|nr:glucosidase [Phycisphaera sp.]